MRSLLLVALLSLSAAASCEKRSDDPVVRADNDNPDMKAAREEAIKRFPEFVQAFTARRPGDEFAVKAGFPIKGSTENEYMWIDVTSISGNVLKGKLASDPAKPVGLKFGDNAETTADQIHDWMIMRRGTIHAGGFQVKVLERLQKEGGQ